MKKFLVSLVFLTCVPQAMSFEQERPDYYEKVEFSCIISSGSQLYLSRDAYLPIKSLIIKQGGLLKIASDCSLKNIILERNVQIIDENFGITLTALSPQETLEKLESFYKVSKPQ